MPDLAVTDHSSDIVSVLLGNGDGTFRPHVWFRTDRNPTGLALGPISTAMAKLDLAVANYFSTTISVLLGNGDGTFQAAQDFGAGLAPIFRGRGRLQRRWQAGHGSRELFSNNVSILINTTGPPDRPAGGDTGVQPGRWNVHAGQRRSRSATRRAAQRFITQPTGRHRRPRRQSTAHPSPLRRPRRSKRWPRPAGWPTVP